MDSLVCYSDSETDESCAATSEFQNKPVKDNHLADFFGLNSSSSDEDVPVKRPHSSVDLLIDTYQLEDVPVGPSLPNETYYNRLGTSDTTQDTSLGPFVKRKKNQADDTNDQCKIRHLKSAEELPERPKAPVEDDVTTPTGNMFQVHPLMAQLTANVTTLKLAQKVKRVLTGHQGCVNTLHWGRQLDSGHLLLSASMDGSVKIWDALASKRSCVWKSTGHGGAAVRCARWCPTNHSVASGGYDKAIRVYDVENGLEVFSGQHRHFVFCLEFHPTVPHLVLCGTLGGVECWDLRDSGSKPCQSYLTDCNEVQDVEFLQKGEEFLCCTNLVSRDSANRTIIAWDFRSGAILSNQIFHERYHCTCLRLHPSENWFVAQTNGDYMALFLARRPYKMNKRRRFEGHKVGGYWVGCDFNSDGRYLYSGSMDGLVYAYDFHTSKICRTIPLSEQPCLAVACHPMLPTTVAISDWSGNIHICC